METIQKTDLLDDAQDVAVVRNLGNERFVYAVKPSLRTQEQLYEISVSNQNDKNIPAYQGYWAFDKKTGIKGSSTFLALRFDTMALRPSGLWLPGLLEAKALESQGKLENGVYRDYGAILYSDKNFNADIAGELLPEAEVLKLQSPLIIPFRALNPSENPKMTYGIGLSFVESQKGVISGQEAQGQIDSLDYKASSGVRGLACGRYGFWGASWNDLVVSDDYGRVDWVCGEATRADLEKAYGSVIERDFSEEIRKLEDIKTKLRGRMQTRQSAFTESLNR